MGTKAAVLVLSSVVISSVAQILLKLGVMGTLGVAADGATSVIGKLAALFVSPGVLAGLALYGIGTIIWLFALAEIDVSLAYPFVGLGFVITCVLSAVVLGEPVSTQRLLGTLLISGGCVLVARSA